MPKNEVDEFLGDVKKDSNEDPFKQESEDPFASKEAKTDKVEDEVVADEKPLPFHKDPKVQRYIQKEIEKVTKGGTRISETEKFVKDTNDKDEADEILTRIIGNDTPEKIQGIKDFKRLLNGLTEKARNEALESIEARQQEEVQQEQQAQEELEQGFENIEETFSVDISSNTPVARKTRNEFIDFIKRVSPKDADGEIIAYPDFEETFKLFQERTAKTAPSNSKAKELASRSMSRSGDASNAPKQKSNSWDDVDRLFSKLES